MLPLVLSVLFNFTGDCVTGCTGQATMEVVTTDSYKPGQIQMWNQGTVLLKAEYSDSVVTHDFLQIDWPYNGDAFRFADSPSEDFLITVARSFHSDAMGNWRFSGEFLDPGCDTALGTRCGYIARGVNGKWIDPPAPHVPWDSTGLLVLLGGGLVYVFGRFRTKETFTQSETARTPGLAACSARCVRQSSSVPKTSA